MCMYTYIYILYMTNITRTHYKQDKLKVKHDKDWTSRT